MAAAATDGGSSGQLKHDVELATVTIQTNSSSLVLFSERNMKATTISIALEYFVNF